MNRDSTVPCSPSCRPVTQPVLEVDPVLTPSYGGGSAEVKEQDSHSAPTGLQVSPNPMQQVEDSGIHPDVRPVEVAEDEPLHGLQVRATGL